MRYRIVCTTQEPVNVPTNHAHIVEVGTGDDPNQAQDKWPLSSVVSAIDGERHEFYVKGEHSGIVVDVITASCPSCGHRIIRSTQDAAYDNNLDDLRRCRW